MKILTSSREKNKKYKTNHKYPKVGDMVWTVENGIPKEMKVYDEFIGQLLIGEQNSDINSLTSDCWHEPEEFGKSFFSNREDAIKFLKRKI